MMRYDNDCGFSFEVPGMPKNFAGDNIIQFYMYVRRDVTFSIFALS